MPRRHRVLRDVTTCNGAAKIVTVSNGFTRAGLAGKNVSTWVTVPGVGGSGYVEAGYGGRGGMLSSKGWGDGHLNFPRGVALQY
eukprot:746353-Hanusia_phi.AAC.2